MVVANGYPNILFVNIVDLKQTYLISKWDNIYQATSCILDIETSLNEKWLFCSLYPGGLIIIDIQDVKNPF